MRMVVLGALPLILAACAENVPTPDGEPLAEIPIRFAPFGDGYPEAGDPCRQLGESPVTAEYLDDSAVLVGCPTAESAVALQGNVVDTIDGVTIVSVPMGDANPGIGEAGPMVEEMPDPPDPETGYNATTMLPCTIDGVSGTCDAGVKRRWGEDGTNLIEVTKPDGRKRAIFLTGTKPIGFDSAEADGSAGWDMTVAREDDRVTVTFGPESYTWVDAFVEGG